MSDHVGNLYCWFSNAKAQISLAVRQHVFKDYDSASCSIQNGYTFENGLRSCIHKCDANDFVIFRPFFLVFIKLNRNKILWKP